MELTFLAKMPVNELARMTAAERAKNWSDDAQTEQGQMNETGMTGCGKERGTTARKRRYKSL